MKSFLYILSCLIIPPVFSQSGSLVIKIEDDKDNIKIEDTNNGSEKILSFQDQRFTKMLRNYRISEFKQLYPSSKRPELLKYYILKSNNHLTLLSEIKRLESSVISYAREDREPTQLFEPNDYDYTTHTGNDCIGDISLTHLDLIRAPEAWDITKGNQDVIIGITETYIDTNHEDIYGKIYKIYDENDSNATEWHHGISVAGTIAASTDNYIGISSIGYNCRIAKTKASTAYNDDLLAMAQEGIKIIEISQKWSDTIQPDHAELFDELINDYGVTVIASAGNENSTEYVYPASYDDVISVTSVGHGFEIGSSTSCGIQVNWKDCHKMYFNRPGNDYLTHTHNDKVDICAPGYYVICLLDKRWLGGKLYYWRTGTSFAAPIVAGVCGLMYSINPFLTPEKVDDIIKNTAVDIYTIPENYEYIGLLGAGRIDAYEAVKEAGTRYLTGQQSGNKSAGFGFVLHNVTINQGDELELTARKEVNINGTFTMQTGSTFEIIIDPNAITNE